MTTKLKLGTDVNNNVTYALPWTDEFYISKLEDATELTLTVPENVNVAFFTFTDGYDIQVQKNGSAIVVPGTGFVKYPNQALKPGARYSVAGGDVLRFLANTGGAEVLIGVEFFNLSQSVI